MKKRSGIAALAALIGAAIMPAAVSPAAAQAPETKVIRFVAVPSGGSSLVWIAADKLKQAGVLDHMPIWVPPSDIGMAQVSHARALKTGLTFRPLATTISDTLAWWQTLPAERQAKVRAGLSAEQEAAALKLR